MLSCLFLEAVWSPAGKGLASWLSVYDGVLCFVLFPYDVPGQVLYLIVSFPHLCLLLYFVSLFLSHG